MIKLKRQFELEYRNKKLIVEQTTYASNGRYALQAYDDGEPYAVLTVNIEAYDTDFPNAKFMFLDTNNVPGIKKSLLDAGLIEDTGLKVQSGFCTYPVVRWLR